MELITKVLELCEDLDEQVHNMAKFGLEEANAEHNYRILRQQETLTEQTAGTPATLIKLIVDGKTADARFERDKARVFYKTALERINATKTQINTYKEQIEREYQNE